MPKAGAPSPKLLRSVREFCDSLHPNASIQGRGDTDKHLTVCVPGVETFSAACQDFIHFCAAESKLRVASPFGHDPQTSVVAFQVCCAEKSRKWVPGWGVIILVVCLSVAITMTRGGPELSRQVAAVMGKHTMLALRATWGYTKTGISLLSRLFNSGTL